MRASSAILLAQAAGYAVADTRTLPQAFASSSDGRLKFTQVDAPVLGPTNASAAITKWNLTIDDTPSGHKQNVVGFGGAVTDATVAAYNLLSADKKADLMRQLMTADGANFTLIRHTIAASDLSAAPAYTYDDNNNATDTDLRSFNLGGRGNLMLSMLKDMKAAQPAMTLLGSPWAPPAWMQLDRKLLSSRTNNSLDHQYDAQFAQYFVKYLTAYKAAGLAVNAITIQNEPLNNNAGMPSLVVHADESASLIRDHVGPAIRDAGFADTQVWAYDHNTDRPDYPQTVLSAAREYVPAVAWHCYAAGEDWTALSAFRERNPDVTQYQTECWTSAKQTKWNQASWFTLGPLRNWAAGSVAWTLGTDDTDGPHLPNAGSCSTCTGLFTVNRQAGTYELRGDFYMLGQYSRYIPRGAVVLAGVGRGGAGGILVNGTGVDGVATVNPDGTRTVVVENKSAENVMVVLGMKSGESWSGMVSGRSVTSWILPPGRAVDIGGKSGAGTRERGLRASVLFAGVVYLLFGV